MYRNLFSIFFLVSLMIACQSSETTDAALEEAGRIHMEAVELDKNVHPKVDAAIERKNQLAVQGRELTEAERQFIQQVESIENSYAYWEENHVEVPGFEHDDHDHDHDHHDHAGHDHDHSHAAPLDVTPADMLIIQQEFRDTLLSIQARLEQLDI
jgi:ABC-type Zn2+ transport system substrate-binding protein/surface adhesin